MAGPPNGSLSQVSNISNLLEQLAIHGGPRALDDARFTWPPADDDVRQAIELAYADGTWGRYPVRTASP